MSVWPAELKLVGKYDGPRIKAVAQVTGTIKYGQDYNLPNQLYMRILRSPYAHAKIIDIDASEALKMKGVVDVITAKDIEKDPVLSTKLMQGTTMRILPFDNVRYAGEEVAALVAEDPYIAEEALSKIKVTYEPLPYVLHVEDAIKPGAPEIHPGGNIIGGKPIASVSYGDVEKGFAAADMVVESRITTSWLQHANQLTWACLVKWDGNRFQIWTDTQYLFGIRNSLATMLEIPASKIEVYSDIVGGGFGDKTGIERHIILAALLARRTGRPVKYRLTREDNFTQGKHRWETVYYIKTGVKKDGTITAMEVKCYGAAGAYYYSTAAMLNELTWIYKFPNFKVDVYTVYTNFGRAGPQRCVADPASCFAIETHMDKIAKQLGMDPIEFRKKNNMYVKGDKDLVTGNRIVSCGQPRVIDRAKELSGWTTKWKPWPKEPPKTGKVRGIGVANHCCAHGAGSLPNAAVIVMNPDGTATIYTGAQDIGNARNEQLILIAAEHLGLPFEKVRVANYSTVCGPDSGVTAGSRQTKSAGNAVGLAALDVKDKLLTRAADRLKVPKEELSIGDEKVYVTKDPTKFVAIRDLCATPWIIGVGQWTPPTGIAQRTYATHIAEVEVDCDTGEVKILRYVAVHDIGRVIYRKSCDSQVHGGVIQGIGMALTEELLYDPQTGKVYNPDFLNFKISTIHYSPEEFIVDFVEDPEEPPDSYNFGAKGLGEPPTSPPMAAIGNAIANAIGVHIDSLPITPEKILKALGKW